MQKHVLVMVFVSLWLTNTLDGSIWTILSCLHKTTADTMLAVTQSKRGSLGEATSSQKCNDILVVPSPSSHYTQRIDDATGRTISPSILVLHYTVTSLAQTLHLFGGNYAVPVASHYTISEDGYVFQHVDESLAAHHAGISYWDKKEHLNKHSIGIEHVNLGLKEHVNQPTGVQIPGSPKEWYPFPQQQILKSIELCKQIILEHNIDPRNIVAHSDIAPGRKSDPGPLFPWKQFADAGVGAWPDMQKSFPLACRIKAERYGNLRSWLIEHLHIWGYMLPHTPQQETDIIRAFQMHFRPSNISGEEDSETADILVALLCTYGVATKISCACLSNS